MVHDTPSSASCRQGLVAPEISSVQTCARSLYTSRKVAATHVSADHKKVSTPDDGDIGRGAHQPAPVGEGDSQDVVPNMVVPDETSGKAVNSCVARP